MSNVDYQSQIYDLETQISFLDILKRYPNNADILHVNSGFTSNNLKDSLKNTTEYLQSIGEHAGDTSFSEWTISASNLSNTNFSGLTLANGKIALITSASYNTVEHSYISTNFDFDNLGSYANNVAEVFAYTNIHLNKRDNDISAIKDVKQSLNMLSASFTTNYKVSVANSSQILVKSEIRAIRHLPYCTMQTITLSSDMNTDTHIDFYHDIVTPQSIGNVRYNNNLININNGNTLYFFQANGILEDLDKSVTTSCAYIFEIENNDFTNKGYNILLSDNKTAYNKFNVLVKPNTDYNINNNKLSKIHILSSTMTQFDFSKPDIETQRILINALTKNPAQIIENHVTEWAKQWIGKIIIKPKDNITVDESNDINMLNKYIKLSLYNIYSIVRDDVNVEINPLNISTIDLNGHIFWSGELWFLPLLTFLKPKATKSLLDYRYFQLENAMKLASAHGYQGSKFAYENDNIAYKNIYWNSISPLQIFNTGLISIAVWNYYRVSRDTDWLRKKGYEILKNNADFFASKMVYNASTDEYWIQDVIGMDNIPGNNNALTNYVAKLSLKFALEAKYELNYAYAVTWNVYINKIKIDVHDNNIINNNDEDEVNHLPVDLLDSLLLLHPYYSKIFMDTNDSSGNPKYSSQTLKDNILAKTDLLKAENIDNSFNRLMLSTLWGTLAQEETSYNNKIIAINNFSSNLQKLFDKSTLIPWKTFYNSSYAKSYNDIGVSSMFLLNILTSLIGLKIEGGTDEARFIYAEYGITTKSPSSYAVMPIHWKTLEVYGVGMNSTDHYCVINSMYYI